MDQFTRLVEQASKLFGVEDGYWDIAGRWHETSQELHLAILTALRVPLNDSGALSSYLDSRRRAGEQHWLPPVSVVGPGEHLIPLSLPKPDPPAVVRLTLESGQIQCWTHTGGGHIRLPDSLPLGYHQLSVSLSGQTQTGALVACPSKAWLPPVLRDGGRRAGLAVSLFGLRSQDTWGCGDFTALERLIDWVVDKIGGSYIALNPLHAIHNRSPFNTSPYLPNSVFYRNLIYLDIDRIEEMARCPEAVKKRYEPATVAEISALNASELVEYERVQQLKLDFLWILFGHFCREELGRGTTAGAVFDEFLRDEGTLLHRYALYSALDAHFHARNPDVWIWPDWPEPYHDPDSPECRQFAEQHRTELLFYSYIQWQIDRQAAHAQRYALDRGMEIGLFHDLPLATDRCGFELWANRPFYVAGCRVGAPPDDFSPQGQDWSFPPPNREAHRTDAYRLFAKSIRRSARHGGALRIDHVMRLFRLYWIPDGFDATQGTYVTDYAKDLLRIVALESVRNRVVIVGEDLGTVEPAMREALAEHGILSYRLFYFERAADGSFLPPEQYPLHALASSTTHDLPTLAGFWAGHDIQTRFRLGLLDAAGRDAQQHQRTRDKHLILDRLVSSGLLPPEFPPSAADGQELSGELHNAITSLLTSTPCMLVTLNQEDLTKELDQQNVPATTWQYPNWRRKMKFSVEDLYSHPLAIAFANMFHDRLLESHRTITVQKIFQESDQ
jgi:4-alpha-glucanotransferase